MTTIHTREELGRREPGQWARFANGNTACLVDTCMCWPHRIWMSQSGLDFNSPASDSVTRLPLGAETGQVEGPTDDHV